MGGECDSSSARLKASDALLPPHALNGLGNFARFALRSTATLSNGFNPSPARTLHSAVGKLTTMAATFYGCLDAPVAPFCCSLDLWPLATANFQRGQNTATLLHLKELRSIPATKDGISSGKNATDITEL